MVIVFNAPHNYTLQDIFDILKKKPFIQIVYLGLVSSLEPLDQNALDQFEGKKVYVGSSARENLLKVLCLMKGYNPQLTDMEIVEVIRKLNEKR